MSNLVACRTCGKRICNLSAKNLFDVDDNEILQNIQKLTGICFEEDKYLPLHICESCNLDLNHAIAFRERCIKTNTLMLERKRRAQAALSPKKLASIKQKHTNINDLLKKQINKPTTCTIETALENQRKLIHKSEDLVQELLQEDIEEIVVNVMPPKDPEYVTSYETGEPSNNKEKRPQTFKNLVCDQCGKCFADASNLKIHILRHSGVKDFKCTECGEKFFTRHLLHLHIRVRHLGEKPYACKYCDLRFFTSTSRCRHERTHKENLATQSKTPVIKCTICNKVFTKKTSLDKHAVVHTGEQPFCCETCNIHFNRKSSLHTHYRSKAHQKRSLKTEHVDSN